MPIMCCDKKVRALLLLVISLAGGANMATATASVWIPSDRGHIQVSLGHGFAYAVAVPDNVDGAFLDQAEHVINGTRYVALYQVERSLPSNPHAVCGAGKEIRLHVYQVNAEQLSELGDILVSSCLGTVSLRSQNTGQEYQETNFSSVAWTSYGFSIDWFEPVDGAGQPVNATQYRIEGGALMAREVIQPNATEPHGSNTGN